MIILFKGAWLLIAFLVTQAWAMENIELSENEMPIWENEFQFTLYS